MDYARHFRREAAMFETALRQSDASALWVPSCPAWSLSDLTLHLGMVHRLVARVVRDRMTVPPDPADSSMFDFPAHEDWPDPDTAPNLGRLPWVLVEWFGESADELGRLFVERDPADTAWTWWTDRTVGFWARMQSIETAVHRWDAQNAVGTPEPIDAELAADAMVQTFEVMAPSRRIRAQAPAGTGERFRFVRTDGDGAWTVTFDGNAMVVGDGDADVEIAASVSDLALFQWGRVPAEQCTVTGDRAVLDRYFTLVPPV